MTGQILGYVVKGNASSKLKHLVLGELVHDDHLGGRESLIFAGSILLLGQLVEICAAMVIDFEVEVGYGQWEILFVF
jgi:hypothetical protein